MRLYLSQNAIKPSLSQLGFQLFPRRYMEKISSYLGNFFGSRHFVQINQTAYKAIDNYRSTLTNIVLCGLEIQSLTPLMRYTALTHAAFSKLKQVSDYSLLPRSLEYLLIHKPTYTPSLNLNRLTNLQELRISAPGVGIQTSMLASMTHLKVLIVSNMTFTQNAPFPRNLIRIALVELYTRTPFDLRNQENLQIFDLVDNLRVLASGATVLPNDPLNSIPFPEKLTRLKLSKVNLRRPNLLARFQNLFTLHLKNCEGTITNNSLVNLKKIIELKIDCINISNPNAITRFTSLMPDLQVMSFVSTQIGSLHFGLPTQHLIDLNLQLVNINQIEGRHLFPSLEILNIKQTQISDLSPFSNSFELKKIDLSYTPVATLEPLKKLKNLEFLDFSSTSIMSLNPLADHLNIHTVLFNNISLESIQPMAKWRNLEYLSARAGSIRSLEGLEEKPYLRCVNLFFNDFHDLSPLRGAPLAVADFSVSGVEDLTPIAGAPLTSLNIAWTSVTNLEPLMNARHLRFLWVNTFANSLMQIREMQRRIPGIRIQ